MVAIAWLYEVTRIVGMVVELIRSRNMDCVSVAEKVSIPLGEEVAFEAKLMLFDMVRVMTVVAELNQGLPFNCIL